MKIRTSLIALTLLLGVPAAQAQEVVTACDQHVTSDEAVLSADLDCSTFTGTQMIVLENGGHFDLGGFTITGNSSIDGQLVLQCNTNCSVVNGTIVPGYRGIGAHAGVRLDDVTISGTAATVRGIQAHGNLIARALVVNGASEVGAVSEKRVLLSGGSISNNAGAGVRAYGRLKLRAVTVDSNGGKGVEGTKVQVHESTVTGNGFDGVRGTLVMAKESTITGNCTDALSTDEPCSDVDSCSEPRLKETDCDTSDACSTPDHLVTSPWGACAAD